MRTLMKTQVPPQPTHDYRNTVVGFRITQEEQTKLKSIQRTMRTRGIKGTTSDALRMILHTFDLQSGPKPRPESPESKLRFTSSTLTYGKGEC